jgi:anti-anti-sigma factor
MEHALNKNGQIVTALLRGDLTFNDHAGFRELLLALAALNDIESIVFDLNDLEFIDSAGIGMLIIANDEALGRNQKLAICGARNQVKMALDVADLKSLVEVREA